MALGPWGTYWGNSRRVNCWMDKTTIVRKYRLTYLYEEFYFMCNWSFNHKPILCTIQLLLRGKHEYAFKNKGI